jgi:uncharacterized protein
VRVLWLSVFAGVIGVTGASIIAAEGALVIRDRGPASPRAADDLARQTDSTWQLAYVTTGDDVVLQGWLFTPERPNGAGVILLHGVGDTRHGMMSHAEFLVRAGYTVLTPDARGHGESGGKFITYGVLEAEDVHLWADWLLARGVWRLYGLGESMGAAILLESLAREPRFRTVVAECPFATFEEVARYRLAQASGAPEWMFRPIAAIGFGYARLRYGVDLTKATPLAAVRAARTPILLIHGDQDTNIPIAQSRELAAANPKWVRLWEVPRATHVNTFGVEPERYIREVLGWFDGQ